MLADTILNLRMGETKLFSNTLLGDSSILKLVFQLYYKASRPHSSILYLDTHDDLNSLEKPQLFHQKVWWPVILQKQDPTRSSSFDFQSFLPSSLQSF